MPNKLIVNIRGANASGKTTLVRNLLANASFSEQGQVAPDGTKMSWHRGYIPGLELPVIVIGKYDDSKYSGCDKIKSVEAIEWAVREAAKEDAHVVFEGFRVSKSYARFAELRNDLVRTSRVTWLWALLHAPEELIFARADARREATSRPTDRKELSGVVRQMDKTRRTVMQLWPRDHVDLRSEKSPQELYDQLIMQMKRREAE